MTPLQSSRYAPNFRNSLLAGAIAGTTVDLTLYPLDTIKTRLQSYQSYPGLSYFKGLYRGVGSALIGSAPGAALFFCTYEKSKSLWNTHFVPPTGSIIYMGTQSSSGMSAVKVGGEEAINMENLGHMISASLGEIAACAVRVPTEVIKQRAQAKQYASSVEALRHILAQRSQIGIRGIWLELYRGWTVTIMREIPFTAIQFPLWETMKALRIKHSNQSLLARNFRPFSESLDLYSKPQTRRVTAAESAFFGSMSGAIAATITTPLDVLKTRMMLARDKPGMLPLLRQILRESGPSAFFAGLIPRVAWISVGGAIFLGSYQWAVNMLEGDED